MRSFASLLAVLSVGCGPEAASAVIGSTSHTTSTPTTAGTADRTTTAETTTTTTTGTTDSTATTGEQGTTGTVPNPCDCAPGEICLLGGSDHAPCAAQCQPLPPECGDAPMCDNLPCAVELCGSYFCDPGPVDYDCYVDLFEPLVHVEGFRCGSGGFFCDPWSQNCPRGQKCAFWDNAGGMFWNTTKCSPVEPDPNQVGEPCTVEGSAFSGVDDCELGAQCWYVDEATNEGTCVPLCELSLPDPLCPAQTRCAMVDDGQGHPGFALAVCLPPCDPLTDNCPSGHMCAVIGETTGCVPVVGAPAGFGEPCTYPNDCAPGMSCVGGPNIPDCASERCCTTMCDLNAPTCPVGAQTCTPFFADPPAGLEHLGRCET